MNDQRHEDYFEKAQSWATQSDHASDRSRKIAWAVALGACAIALVQGLAIFAMLPLKETETITLLVDRTTGYVQEVDPGSASRIRADEALTQSLLAQYVTARESFDRAALNTSYQKAALFSSGTARQSYINQMSAQGVINPANRLQRGEILSAEVKSVSQARPGSAIVRFDTFVRSSSGQTLRDGSWIAVIDYHFSNAAMSYEDRLINPLGLQVTNYRKDAERPLEEQTIAVPPAERFRFEEAQ